MRGLFFSAALLAIVISVAIVVSLAGGAIDFLSKVELDKLWSRGWFPRRNLFDVKTIFAGTLLVSAIAMIVAAPVGLGAALYLSEYASRRSRRFLKPILETLASVPSVVMAFFALRFISPEVIQRFFGTDVPIFNIAAAGLAVGLLVTPLVASVAEDAMHAVPGSLREASVGLGARRRTTSIRIVMPAAVSGITAALILGLSRAIGETMIVAIVAGGTGGSLFSLDVRGILRGQSRHLRARVPRGRRGRRLLQRREAGFDPAQQPDDGPEPRLHDGGGDAHAIPYSRQGPAHAVVE